MERKKGKDKFHALVEECFGRDILSIERSRKFSRRARQYMVSYYMLEKDGKSTTPMDVKITRSFENRTLMFLKKIMGICQSVYDRWRQNRVIIVVIHDCDNLPHCYP